MNQFVLNQMNDWTKDVQVFQMPKQVKEMVEGSVEQTKEKLATASDLIRETAKQYDKAFDATRKDAFELSNKVLENTQANTAEALQLATDLLAAKSPKDIADIQMQFWQTHSKELARQSTELFELTQALMNQSIKSMGDLTSKATKIAK